MLLYLLKCKKNTESINPSVSQTSNGRTRFLSKSAVCNSRNSRFIKEKQASGLFRKLAIKNSFN